MRKILNLGCGNKPIEGAVNHDVTRHSPHVDIAHDLSVLPWPWDDEAFDFVAALSVLEHLEQNLLTSMNEIWRILTPGGVSRVKLPYWKAEVTWDDPTHRWPVGTGVMDQLDPTTKRGHGYAFYTPYKWKIIKGPELNPGQTSVHWTLRKMPLNWNGK